MATPYEDFLDSLERSFALTIDMPDQPFRDIDPILSNLLEELDALRPGALDRIVKLAEERT